MSSSPYAPAARLLNEVWTQHKSLKSLAYTSKGELRCSKATYAQVCHVLEQKGVLDALMGRVDLGTAIRNKALAYVLLYELLLGPNQSIRGGGALKRTLKKREESLRKALKEVQKEDQPYKNTVAFPRYVRVNTLRTSLNQVITTLLQNEKYTDKLFCDVHVPNLLVLPPAARLQEDFDLVQSYKVVLQDKSSCFSALCLVHGSSRSKALVEDRGDVLDACAAPGNKTSHLAALIAEVSSRGRRTTKKRKREQPTVYALDRSSSRFESLQRRMEEIASSSGGTVKVVCQHRDFLQTKPSEYPNLRSILLDPSCSGSGIYTSPDRYAEAQQRKEENEHTSDSQKRLESLSNFQLTCLKHAMSFKQVERIVYSTCSLHDIENEGVVAQATKENEDWEIVAPACLRHWRRRGHAVMGLSPQQAQCLIRANHEDDTNGFFVCYLKRKRDNVRETSSPPSRQANEKNVVFDPPEGLTFYEGQHKQSSGGQEAPENSDERDDRNVQDRKSSAAKAELIQEERKSVILSRSIGQDPKNPAMSRKRAKKIAWKKRQMEQKMKRMQTKKQKLERTQS